MMRLIGLALMLQATAQQTPDPRAQAAASRAQIGEALAAVEALDPGEQEQEECITPKRDALRILRDVGLRIEAELLEAMADEEEQHVALATRKLAVAQARAEQLRADAEACLPSAIGDSNTTTTGPLITDTGETNAPPEDPTDPDPPSSSQFE